MNKSNLIILLEGKEVPIPSGEYKLVKDGKLVTDFGKFSLLWYEIGQLETMLKYAKVGIDRRLSGVLRPNKTPGAATPGVLVEGVNADEGTLSHTRQ